MKARFSDLNLPEIHGSICGIHVSAWMLAHRDELTVADCERIAAETEECACEDCLRATSSPKPQTRDNEPEEEETP